MKLRHRVDEGEQVYIFTSTGTLPNGDPFRRERHISRFGTMDTILLLIDHIESAEREFRKAKKSDRTKSLVIDGLGMEDRVKELDARVQAMDRSINVILGCIATPQRPSGDGIATPISVMLDNR